MSYQNLSPQEQLEYKRIANRKAYLKRVGGKLTRISPLENTPERKKQRLLDKANARCTRAKLARRKDELTQFVYKEAHDLRKLRNKLTNIEWHVDHVIPLKGKTVSGLHIWNNFAVIPKKYNLKKGNNHAFYDQWEAGLQEGTEVGEDLQAESSEGQSESEQSEVTDGEEERNNPNCNEGGCGT